MSVSDLIPRSVRPRVKSYLIAAWISVIVALFSTVIVITFFGTALNLHLAGADFWSVVTIGACLSFGAEWIDSSLGMGYGTTLTPLLMLLGFSPLQVVPAVLLQELVSGTIASLSHHGLGNVDLRPGRPALKLALVLGGCALVGSFVAARVAFSLPPTTVKLVTGIIVMAMGVLALAATRMKLRFSWWRVGGLGMVAAANKGFMGGGYGPLVTTGQLVVGGGVRQAVAVTSLSEALTCVGGLASYLVLGTEIYWPLAIGMLAGGTVAAVLSAATVRAVDPAKLRGLVAGCCLLLGVLTLARALMT